MRYYRSYIESTITQLMKWDGLNKTDRAKLGIAGGLHRYGHMIGGAASDMDLGIIAEELAWNSTGRHTILLPDLVIAQVISGTSFVLETVEGIESPLPFFRVAVPDRLTFAGRSISGLQIAVYPIASTERLYAPLRNHRMLSGPVRTSGIMSGQENEMCLSVAYPISSGSKFSIGRVTIPMKLLPQVLSAKSMLDVLPRQGEGLSEKELADQFSILQFAVRLLLYVNARPDALTAGLPGLSVNMLDCEMETHHRILMSGSPTERTGHYRRGHFRQLRSSVFYQGQYSAMPIGSRFVFVHDTYVGAKNDEIHALSA